MTPRDPQRGKINDGACLGVLAVSGCFSDKEAVLVQLQVEVRKLTTTDWLIIMDYDDATLDMMAMEFRAKVAEKIDELINVFGRSRMVITKDGRGFVSTEMLYGIAAVLADRGAQAGSTGKLDASMAYADGATMVNVLALRADNEEPNLNTEDFFS